MIVSVKGITKIEISFLVIALQKSKKTIKKKLPHLMVHFKSIRKKINDCLMRSREGKEIKDTLEEIELEKIEQQFLVEFLENVMKSQAKKDRESEIYKCFVSLHHKLGGCLA